MKTLSGQWHTNYSLGACLAMILVVAGSCAQQSGTAKLLELATNGTGQARYVAIDDLGERAADPATVVPALIKLLADSDAQVQWRSARALGDYGADAASAAPELRAFLANADPVHQIHAAVALGKIGDHSEATVDALVTAVGSSDGRVSRAAVAAIRNLKPGPQKVLAALKKALAADDQAVTVRALEAIVELGAEAVTFLNEALKDPETVYLACSAIEQIGPDAAATTPGLVDLLGHTSHSQMQIQALLALASIGPAAKAAVPSAVALLENSPDATVPVAAAFALGSIGDAEADAALRAAEAKENPLLQLVATWSLAKIHPQDAELKKQAVDKLNAGLKSEDPAIKAAAEKGLKLLEAPAAAAAQ